MTKRRRAYIRAGRILSPVALLGLRIYTMITHRPRVRVIVTNEYDEILLVRGIISHLGWWMLPGGGVNRGEELVVAAQRELHEETGIHKSLDNFHYIRTIEKSELGFNFSAPLFRILVKKSDLPKSLYNPVEIAEIGWYKLDKLPELTAAVVFLAIDELSAVN
ncbi:MAG: ADP-ribose pyrophosphatase [Candidatus Saccharibacteria bacterium]|nr:ADP-ribose pyrophosphatase [Candidatus Saccharibacteria bacterium]